jgi:hypothetical protein
MAPKYTMSDSEEEVDVAPTVPSDQALEKGLRDGVAAVYKAGNMEELTVKRVRLAVEKKLGLTEGYFKSTDDWKARSEEIIRDEVVRKYINCEWSFDIRTDIDLRSDTGNTRQRRE